MPVKPHLLGIDPGNKESAYCLCSPDLAPVRFAKLPNDKFMLEIMEIIEDSMFPIEVVIEDVESFGMPVGRSVIDTEKFVGFISAKIEELVTYHYIYRHEEKMTICHSPKANDATIKHALVDRFAPGASNHGKGTKKSPGFFYGFRADCWSAFAICVTYHDKYLDLHLDELPF